MGSFGKLNDGVARAFEKSRLIFAGNTRKGRAEAHRTD
jgi:hypothetical protein